MGHPISKNMCCSVRDKDMRKGFLPVNETVPFDCTTAETITIQQPRFLALAPLWHDDEDGPKRRRLAVASDSKVHLYRVPDESTEKFELDGASNEGSLRLEYTLDIKAGMSISALTFGRRGDERKVERNSAMSLIVACGAVEGVAAPSSVRVWSTTGAQEEEFEAKGNATTWQWSEGHVITEEHTARVSHLAACPQVLLTADGVGICRVWDKQRWTIRATEQLLDDAVGGLADLVAERHFAFSAGRRDLVVKIWALPELRLISQHAALPMVQGPLSLALGEQPYLQALSSLKLSGRSADPTTEQIPTPAGPSQLLQLTGLRRPASRWCGAQASEKVRAGAGPRGLLFVTGLLGSGMEAQDSGPGLLMVWSLGKEPQCLTVQIAHEAKIAAIAYGPYDNGPLVTADVFGVFRVWEFTPRLVCLQYGDIGGGAPCVPAIVMDPLDRGLYSIVGDQRLFLWRQRGQPGMSAASAPEEGG